MGKCIQEQENYSSRIKERGEKGLLIGISCWRAYL